MPRYSLSSRTGVIRFNRREVQAALRRKYLDKSVSLSEIYPGRFIGEDLLPPYTTKILGGREMYIFSERQALNALIEAWPDLPLDKATKKMLIHPSDASFHIPKEMMETP